LLDILLVVAVQADYVLGQDGEYEW